MEDVFHLVDYSDVFHLVDYLINCPEYNGFNEHVFSERLGRVVPWSDQAALEEKAVEWSKEHPVIWNVGIGRGGSFVPTLTRLLFERTKDIYGPYDHIIAVRLPPAEAASSSTDQHRLAFEVLTGLLMLDDSKQLRVLRKKRKKKKRSKQLRELKQLAAEGSYFGYGSISDNLMLLAFGRRYIDLFASDQSIHSDPICDRQPGHSPILLRIREALEGKRQLLLVENLHFPVSLDVLVFTMGERLPSIFQNRRWLISTNSKDVYEKSRGTRSLQVLHFTPEYYYDLRSRDWAALIVEALRDAARSIYMALKLQDKGDEEFWLHVAQRCFYYGILYHQLRQAAGSKASNASSITSDELVRCWVAEDMLFSTTSPTNTPAAIGKKQSNYYMSAYEAGKVVIQALQEYSLLPTYSVSTTTVSTSSSEEDVITGVSKLADNVPRLRQDELNTRVRSNQLRWVSFMNDDGRHVSWDWGPNMRRENTGGDIMLTTLILRGCSNMSVFPLDKLLTPHLRVLDLSHTPINSLPPSFSRLLNLYLLSLRGCSLLETLFPLPRNSDKETSPLAYLENLEVLDMNGVPLLELTEQDCRSKSHLHYLDLSGSKVTTLPPEFFSDMSNLEELILGNCSNLIELPLPVAELFNLLVLHVEGTQISSFPEKMFEATQSLHTLRLINNLLLMRLPKSLSKAKGLKELHLCNCAGLSTGLEYLGELVPCLEDLHIETWKSLENVIIHGHPNLRTFSLSGPWIRRLSLRECSKLKIVNFSDDLTDLEDVDLSRTDLEEVPHNLPNLPQLRMLLLHGVPCSMRFPWHQLVCFPKIFYLDHYVDDDNQADGNHQEGERTTNIAQININDPRMFHSFNDAAKKLVKEGQFLQSFNVQVKPCSVRGKVPRTMIQSHPSSYDILYVGTDNIVPPMMNLQPKQRHVEISDNNQYPNGLRNILSVTNTIFITDDNFIRCLTDLNYSLMSLEECQLLHCNQMTVVLRIKSPGTQVVLESLRILQASRLVNLLCIVEPSKPSNESAYELITLKLLKHIHLEHCPRLEKLFPCSLSLPALDTLVILFCSNLKTIFYKQSDYKVAPSPLPNIKSIHLLGLPQLLHIHDDVTFRFETPKWEKLFVRGCQSFHHLPLLMMELPKSKVEVSGERQWWDRLQLKLPEQSDYYLHVPPPEIASRRKHIIKSYLR